MRASYRIAIGWIAFNDDCNIGDEDHGYLISICLVADLFGKSQETVARAVLARRKKEGMPKCAS